MDTCVTAEVMCYNYVYSWKVSEQEKITGFDFSNHQK